MLDAYAFTDLRLRYTLKKGFLKDFSFTFLVQNVFDAKFVSNAWTYRFRSRDYNPVPDNFYAQVEDAGQNVYNLTGLYPQAGRNYLLGLTFRF